MSFKVGDSVTIRQGPLAFQEFVGDRFLVLETNVGGYKIVRVGHDNTMIWAYGTEIEEWDDPQALVDCAIIKRIDDTKIFRRDSIAPRYWRARGEIYEWEGNRFSWIGGYSQYHWEVVVDVPSDNVPADLLHACGLR